MRKIKVDAAQASELMAAGYEIECYVLVEPAQSNGSKKIKHPTYSRIPSNTMFIYSMSGKPPNPDSKLGSAWQKVQKKLWGKNATNPYSKAHIEEELTKAGYAPVAVAVLSRRYGVLRKVTSKE